MACRDVARLRGAFLALELGREQEAALREHLAGCPECAAALAANDAAAALALRLGSDAIADDPTFVTEVMGGIHQRRVERRFARRRRGMLAMAAGLLLAVLAGWAWLQSGGVTPPVAVAERERPAATAAEPAFVEVEGEGVRLYQLDTASHESVRIALIVDPQLEL